MQPAEVTANLLRAQHVDDVVALLGVRGYFRDGMGEPGKNDRGVFDDAIFLSSPSCHMAFNANVDPSFWRPGIAVLQPGVYRFGLSVHGKSRPVELQYPCLEQVGDVMIRRDGSSRADRGDFTIQIHRGYRTDTASLGCQTIPSEQYDSFISTVADQLRRYRQETIPYLLMEYQG